MYNISNNFTESALYYFDYYDEYLDYETNYINEDKGCYIYK